MNIPRMFANAIVRRLAYVVVAPLFAAIASLLGTGTAQAQVAGCTFSSATAAQCQTADQARAAAASMPQTSNCPAANPYFEVQHQPSSKRFVLREIFANGGCGQGAGWSAIRGTATYQMLCPVDGGLWNEETQSCETCDSRAPLGPGAWSGVNDDMQMCQDGCTFEGGIGTGVGVCLPVVIDGTTYQHCTSWGPTGEVCSAGVGNGSLAPPDSDGDGTSDGNDSSPNNPGSGGGGGQNGEGQPEDGSSTCGGPDQPACEADGSNSGSGKGNTSGGGGNCQTPPSSTGDAILAQIAYQAWATRCAVEGLGQGGTGTGPGTGDGDQPDWTKGDGPAAPEDTSAEDVAEASNWGVGISADLLDTENIFGESSCPALPALSIMGYEIDTASFAWWCTLVSIMRAAILIMGAFTAIQILLGRF